jgi:spore maturation protein CgeB
MGMGVQSLTEAEFVPIRWRSSVMRALGKAIRTAAVREFNQQLVSLARSFRPHLFLSIKGPFVEAASVLQIKELGATCICYFPDVSFVAHSGYLPRALPEYDWVFTTKSFGCADFKTLFGKANCSYLPHAFDPDVHRPRTPAPDRLQEYTCDMSFIGSWSPGKEQVLTEIITRMPRLDLRIWGERWHHVRSSSPLAPCLRKYSVLGPSYAEAISCSKVNLALVHERVKGSSSGDLITSRTFHIPGTGGFMLHQRTPDLLEIFTEDVHCAAFADPAEAVEKTQRYLEDAGTRSGIAEEGRRLVENAHSWDHRVLTILHRYFSLQQRETASAVESASSQLLDSV